MVQSLKLLFLTSNPKGEKILKIKDEYDEITNVFNEKKIVDCDVRYEPATSVSKLSKILKNHKPDIVHFSGHGMKNGELVFKNKDDGYEESANVNTIGEIFGHSAKNTKIVFLNSCYSEFQANEILKHIPVVIGMNNAVGDDAAIVFSTFFYQILGAGGTIKKAFDEAITQLHATHRDEAEIPLIKYKNPKSINFSLHLNKIKFESKKNSKYVFDTTIPKNISELCLKLNAAKNNISIWYELIIEQFTKVIETKACDQSEDNAEFAKFIMRRELDEIASDSTVFLSKIKQHPEINEMMIKKGINSDQLDGIEKQIKKFQEEVKQHKHEMWLELKGNNYDIGKTNLVVEWICGLDKYRHNIRKQTTSIVSKLEEEQENIRKVPFIKKIYRCFYK